MRQVGPELRGLSEGGVLCALRLGPQPGSNPGASLGTRAYSWEEPARLALVGWGRGGGGSQLMTPPQPLTNQSAGMTFHLQGF